MLCWFFWNEIRYYLITHVPWVHEEFTAFVLSYLGISYFHMRTVLSTLAVKRVSDLREYAKASTVPVCPVKVCTIAFVLI